MNDPAIKALPWALFAPFVGGLGASQFFHGDKQAARIRFFLTGFLLAMMIFILATVDPFSDADPAPIIFAGLGLYALVWLFDAMALITRLARTSDAGRSWSLGTSAAAGSLCVAWVMGWITLWAIQRLPFGLLAAWGVLSLSMIAFAAFALAVGAKSEARSGRLVVRLVALWIGGHVGLLGAADALNRDRDAALGWSLVGLPVAAFVFVAGGLAVRETGTVGAAFGLTAALYLLLWALVAARTVVVANASAVPGADQGAREEPVGT